MEFTMNKKSLLGLLLASSLIITALFAGATFLISQENSSKENANYRTEDNKIEDEYEKNESTAHAAEQGNTSETAENTDFSGDLAQEPWLTANPSDDGENLSQATQSLGGVASGPADGNFSISQSGFKSPQLIYDCNEIDYKSYIPEMVIDSKLEGTLDIVNPKLDVKAEAAILLDGDTQEILFHKNAVQAMFPASTAKLLTSLVALKWCEETEEVTIGDEISMIASDSTRAYLVEGEVLTIRNLLEGMLLPSGNDAAYAVAVYVGRKSLDNPDASKEEAVVEFIRLMNQEAKALGVKNSCFMTPDGYDAIGQYTTAYDMGLIGIAAAKNKIITEVTKQSCSRNIFVSGEDVTWYNTNKLVTKYSGQYYSCAIGLKTGTSTMAGRCMVAAAEQDGRIVVCVIMDSTSAGRWEDAITLLKYGLGR